MPPFGRGCNVHASASLFSSRIPSRIPLASPSDNPSNLQNRFTSSSQINYSERLIRGSSLPLHLLSSSIARPQRRRFLCSSRPSSAFPSLLSFSATLFSSTLAQGQMSTGQRSEDWPQMVVGADRQHAEATSAAQGKRAEGDDDGNEKKGKLFTNRLTKEKSPYLLQHAHNPVDWYPWGEEAFEKARKEDKLIFLSVGYSTCHWCHVMEVESFEEEEVARLLNESYVSIKVDREERPDVDKVYMAYVQATSGGGGWPMSVFLTPSLHPILGGTYFPPEDKFGRIGFKSLLKRVKSVWDQRREDVERGGEDAMRQLAEASVITATSASVDKALAGKALDSCVSQLASRFDSVRGGFGNAPKFPRPVEVNALLFCYHLHAGKEKDVEEGKQKAEGIAQKALQMARLTLQKMGRGGIHDHIGGGFHRYSVDEFWHVPHFEKMLYDQSQLAMVYLDAFLLTRDMEFARSARDILSYLRREMTHEEGGLYSAEDADSFPHQGANAKKEGAFYLWTSSQVEEILGKGSERARLFAAHYRVQREGNCNLSALSDPQGEFVAQNCLIELQSVADTAKAFSLPKEEVEETLGKCREVLYNARRQRPAPHLDDKIIVAWNGLAIGAFSRASRILKSEPSDVKFHFPVEGCDPSEYLRSAVRAADFIYRHLYNAESKRLTRSFREGPSRAMGFIDDYAFLVFGLLDLFEASGDARWLEWALDLQHSQDELFLDKEGGGYYSTGDEDSGIKLRMKEDYDGAEPSGNSIASWNLLRLAEIVGGDSGATFRATAEKTLAAFEERMARMPLAVPQMCCSLRLSTIPSWRQLILAGDHGASDMEALLDATFSVFTPSRIVISLNPEKDSDQATWQRLNPHALAMVKGARRDQLEQCRNAESDRQVALAFICQNFTCKAPTSDPSQVTKILSEGDAQPKVTYFKL